MLPPIFVKLWWIVCFCWCELPFNLPKKKVFFGVFFWGGDVMALYSYKNRVILCFQIITQNLLYNIGETFVKCLFHFDVSSLLTLLNYWFYNLELFGLFKRDGFTIFTLLNLVVVATIFMKHKVIFYNNWYCCEFLILCWVFGV